MSGQSDDSAIGLRGDDSDTGGSNTGGQTGSEMLDDEDEDDTDIAQVGDNVGTTGR